MRSRSPHRPSTLLSFSVLPVALAALALPAAEAAASPATRDPLQWPFARTGIWNTPIGTQARYVPARITSRGFGVDTDWFVRTRAGDPAVPVHMPVFYDQATGGKRWPAALADSGAPQQYRGSVRALRMGALLALPPAATAATLGVRSAAGRKVLAALRDFGGYVVDDSGLDAVDLCVEHEAEVDFARRTGHGVDADPGLRADMDRIVRVLAVVDDNSSASIGGHGGRRAPLAPPFRAAGTAGAGTSSTSSTRATRAGTARAGTARAAATAAPGSSPPVAGSAGLPPATALTLDVAPVAQAGSAPAPLTPWLFGVGLLGVAGLGLLGHRRRRAVASP